ncbi:MAG: helix-turn-helix transcriptional regulator [Brevundimonas sp.]|nr:MAG: helix-turn-helix transcriptional regulator [Brevundimonas sp.]
MARGRGADGPHPVDRHVGRRVCEKRVELGFNQSDLGRAIDVTFQQVQKYEKGTNRISASKLWQVAAFNVDISYFFDGLAGPNLVPGMAEDAANFQHERSPTRYSIEISRLAPQLSPARQKLALELIREMTAREADDLDT